MKPVSMFFKVTFILYIVVGMGPFLFGQSAGTGLSTTKRGKFIMVPLLFYTPETRTGGGAAINYTYWADRWPHNNPPSNLNTLFIFTQNKQFTSELKADNVWAHGTIFTGFNVLLGKYPDKFYGIGNNTKDEDEEDYIHSYAVLKMNVRRKMAQNFYIGVGYEFEYSENSDFQEGGFLAGGDVLGSEGGIDSGLGVFFLYDTRDSMFFPLTGGQYLFTCWVFNRMVGSDYDFTRYTFDARKYISPFFSHVIAFQAYLNIVNGEVPFHMLSLFGGQSLMRGYYFGRYRDKNMIALQAEYRLPLIWKIGIAGFGGVGDVAESLDSFRITDFKYSVGAGLRILMNSRDRINLRLDYAFGKDSRGFYVSLFEAF